MDIRQLRYFVQIVESGSLSKASRQLFIVQPALSQQMARLEEEVGKPLLVRSVRGVVATDNGAALYRHAKFVLRQLDEAVAVARHDSATVQGRVAVGLASSTSVMLALPLLQHLKTHYPGIRLNIVVGLPGHLEERARGGQIDVGVLFSRTAASEMAHEPLLDEDIVVIVPARSSLVPRSKRSLTLAEIASLPLVLSSPQHSIRRRLMLEFERNGLEADVVAEIDSLELVMRYVAQGGGATVQPMAAARTVPCEGGWRCLPVCDAPMARPNYLYALPLSRLSPSVSVVRSELRRVVHGLVRTGQWQGVRLAPAEGRRDGDGLDGDRLDGDGLDIGLDHLTTHAA